MSPTGVSLTLFDDPFDNGSANHLSGDKPRKSHATDAISPRNIPPLIPGSKPSPIQVSQSIGQLAGYATSEEEEPEKGLVQGARKGQRKKTIPSIHRKRAMGTMASPGRLKGGFVVDSDSEGDQDEHGRTLQKTVGHQSALKATCPSGSTVQQLSHTPKSPSFIKASSTTVSSTTSLPTKQLNKSRINKLLGRNRAAKTTPNHKQSLPQTQRSVTTTPASSISQAIHQPTIVITDRGRVTTKTNPNSTPPTTANGGPSFTPLLPQRKPVLDANVARERRNGRSSNKASSPTRPRSLLQLALDEAKRDTRPEKSTSAATNANVASSKPSPSIPGLSTQKRKLASISGGSDHISATAPKRPALSPLKSPKSTGQHGSTSAILPVKLPAVRAAEPILSATEKEPVSASSATIPAVAVESSLPPASLESASPKQMAIDPPEVALALSLSPHVPSPPCLEVARDSNEDVLFLSCSPKLSPEAQPYFEYSVFQKVWSKDQVEEDIVATEITVRPFTDMSEANKQADKAFQGSCAHLGIFDAILESSNKRDEYGCVIFAGCVTPFDNPKKKSRLKIWVQRDAVSKFANQTPQTLKTTPFISSTCYILRLFNLAEQAEGSDGSDSGDSEPLISESVRVYHPHTRSEIYTTLGAANRAARALQIELSHEKEPKGASKAFQEKNLEELNAKVVELQAAERNGMDGCWKSKFNACGLGADTLEVVVEKTSICGPRNL